MNAPRLYSDTLYPLYMENMARFGLSSYSLALAKSARADMIKFYSECLASATKLHNEAVRLSQEKGIFLRALYIPTPDKVEFIQKQSFLGT